MYKRHLRDFPHTQYICRLIRLDEQQYNLLAKNLLMFKAR